MCPLLSLARQQDALWGLANTFACLCLTAQLCKMPRHASGDQRLANRSLVLNIHMLEPQQGASAIAHRVGINESSVRSILSRFGGSSTANGPPPAHPGAGRPQERTGRWMRYVFLPWLLGFIPWLLMWFHFLTPFTHSHRTLRRMVTQNPFSSLAQLCTAMYQWEQDMLLNMPPGSVVRVPRRCGKSSMQRCNPYSWVPRLEHGTPLHDIFINYRYLLKMGIKNCRAAKVPMLTKKHMRTRLQFSSDMLTYDWSKVLPLP